MKLYLNKTSPYARLVMVVAHEKGLEKRIEPVWTDPWESPPELIAANPFSKVPALATDSGVTIVDSTCICDHLDEVGEGRRLIPQRGAERLRTLRKYGLGRGLIDAAFAVTIERRFHDGAAELPLATRWLAAVGRALEAIDRDAELLSLDGSPDIGDLSLAVGLSYTEFRLPEVQWKATAPSLAKWSARMAVRPSMQATTPK